MSSYLTSIINCWLLLLIYHGKEMSRKCLQCHKGFYFNQWQLQRKSSHLFVLNNELRIIYPWNVPVQQVLYTWFIANLWVHVHACLSSPVKIILINFSCSHCCKKSSLLLYSRGVFRILARGTQRTIVLFFYKQYLNS